MLEVQGPPAARSAPSSEPLLALDKVFKAGRI